MSLNAGDTFAQDFRVVRLIKAGAMGVVYEVEQVSTGAARALKVMAPELVGDAAIRQRFQLEARIGAQIQSDHIVEVIAAGVDPQRQEPYLVMELLYGESLEDLCSRAGQLSWGDVAEIVQQFTHGLAAAHALGIVHRDLKPDNLFIAQPRGVGKQFTVKILDFGIAKSIADAHRQTQALGTPLYMAPEQALVNAQVDPSTDVWAIGLIVFRCLAGREYWLNSNETLLALLKEIAETPLVAPSSRVAELSVDVEFPAGFDEWFARCVTREVSHRFVDAAAAGAAFLELIPESRRQVTLRPEVSQSQPRLSLPSHPPNVPAVPRVTLLDGSPAKASFRSEPSPSSSSGGTQLSGTPATGTQVSGGGATMGNARVAVYTDEQRPSRRVPLLGAGAALMTLGLGGAVLLSGAGRLRGGEAPESERNPPGAATVTPAVSATADATPPVTLEKAPCPAGMTYIAGGVMYMGETALDGIATPAHQVTVGSYCLDTTEVTAAAYDRCVNAGACPRAPNTVSYSGVTPQLKEVFATLCNFRQLGREQHPINCVPWQAASHYCAVKGGRTESGGARLPTEAEWEFAARGSAQWLYPWGDAAPDETRLNACGEECAAWQRNYQGNKITPLYPKDDGYPGTAPVGRFPAGATQAGILDLAGNVWEWTSDWFGPYTQEPKTDPKGAAEGTQRVVRGGGFNGVDASWAKPSYRWKTTPETFTHVIGFRCANDAVE